MQCLQRPMQAVQTSVLHSNYIWKHKIMARKCSLSISIMSLTDHNTTTTVQLYCSDTTCPIFLYCQGEIPKDGALRSNLSPFMRHLTMFQNLSSDPRSRSATSLSSSFSVRVARVILTWSGYFQYLLCNPVVRWSGNVAQGACLSPTEIVMALCGSVCIRHWVIDRSVYIVVLYTLCPNLASDQNIQKWQTVVFFMIKRCYGWQCETWRTVIILLRNLRLGLFSP